MKKRIRKRRVLKWLSLGLTLALIATFAMSMYFVGGVKYKGRTLGIGYCAVIVSGINADQTFGCDLYPNQRPKLEIISRWVRTTRFGKNYQVIIPLWIPLLAVAIVNSILWRIDRRNPETGCDGCGYNLTGNISGVCPECGTPIATN